MNLNNVWLDKLRAHGATWKHNATKAPHVKTSLSGKHVDTYFNSGIISVDKKLTKDVVHSLHSVIRDRGLRVDWVVGHLPYSKFVVDELAGQLRARIAYSQPALNHTLTKAIPHGEVVLVVSDEIYSGGSVSKTINELERKGVVVADLVTCFANMSNDDRFEGREVLSAITIPTRFFSPDNCALCSSGSVAITPRDHWKELTNSASDLEYR